MGAMIIRILLGGEIKKKIIVTDGTDHLMAHNTAV